MPDPVEIDILFPDPIISNVAVDRLGSPGINGTGVPAGGTINQVLTKNSSTNYDTGWVNQSGGGTVTNTGGALTNSNVIIGNGGSDVKSDSGFRYLGESAEGGINIKLVEPNAGNNGAGGGGYDNNRWGVNQDFSLSGLKGPGNYANSGGFNERVNIFNGRNSPDNNDKKTQFGRSLNIVFSGSGQHSGSDVSVVAAGAGDAIGRDSIVYSGGYNTAPGDEGTAGYDSRIFQVLTELFTPIVTSASTGASTTTTGSITKSTDSTQTRTVGVASSTGLAVGNWVTIEQGVYGSTDANCEVVKLTAVGTNTITALFQADHNSGVTITPCRVLTVANMESHNLVDNRLGQDRVAIVSNDVSYSTGTIVSITDIGSNKFRVIGSGTTWTTAMVGGDSNLAGAVAFDSDTFASDVYASSPLKSWFPIQTVESSTSMVIYNYTGSMSAAVGTTYSIRPCARIGALDVNTTSTDMTISSVVLRSNSFAWPVGKTFDQTVTPWGTVQRGILSFINWYGPNLGLKACFDATNGGFQLVQDAYSVSVDYMSNTLNKASYNHILSSHGNHTAQGAINITGIDDTAKGIGFVPFNVSVPNGNGDGKDDKAIHWEGNGFPVSEIRDEFTRGLTFDSSIGKIYWTGSIGGFQHHGIVWDFTASQANGSGDFTIVIPYIGGGSITLGGLVASGRIMAQTSNATIKSYTVGGVDSSFEVSANMNVTAATALSTSLNCDYTDESNTARTMIFPVTGLTGSFLSGGLVTATGAFETPVMHIRCKASTNITLYTATGTFTSVTYTAEGNMKQTR